LTAASDDQPPRKKGTEEKPRPSSNPAILFDLDGTLLDSNYEHVLAWRLALRREGLEIPNAFLHRCIGMRGELLIKAAFKEIGRTFRDRTKKRLERLHKTYFEETLSSIRPLPGSVALLKALSRRKSSWAIATGGDKHTVRKMLRHLPVPAATPVITADHVQQAKPDPDVFLIAAQELGVALSDCIVVGDSIWDLLGARRAKALGVGLRSGGYGEAELVQAGAYRVYQDPADLLDHLPEIGIPLE
jgi:HAD superfamily hydrolase (TIGR01509 family)